MNFSFSFSSRLNIKNMIKTSYSRPCFISFTVAWCKCFFNRVSQKFFAKFALRYCQIAKVRHTSSLCIGRRLWYILVIKSIMILLLIQNQYYVAKQILRCQNEIMSVCQHRHIVFPGIHSFLPFFFFTSRFVPTFFSDTTTLRNSKLGMNIPLYKEFCLAI